MRLQPNQKIIFDSGSGYELGYFIETHADIAGIEVELVTGSAKGKRSIYNKCDVMHYCETNYNYCVKMYGVEKSFPEQVENQNIK